MTAPASARFHIRGIVQGVGFRPFVYGLATRLELKGWVRNTSAGVDIEVDGTQAALEQFARALQQEAPPLARIDDLQVWYGAANGYQAFEIVHSEAIPAAFQPISPDVAICDDCLRELFDPHDRRYRYPFINCTNCGPRFTIIVDIPYDRPKTSMAGFALCPQCLHEYQDPLDRRFHAQPVACPVCGPQAWLEVGGERVAQGEAAIRQARRMLKEGAILAVKGLGGFHLACDATQAPAVAALRQRKLRVDKPFALMMADVETVERHCWLDDDERALLRSPARPIVLLRRRPESSIARTVAPGQDTLGVMLPYTPLHYLLFADAEQERLTFDLPPLVMTSGNLSEEPIASENAEARARLADLADAFLMHDRPIHTRCDDSVVRLLSPALSAGPGKSRVYPLRRSRGYAPFPVRLPQALPSVLATGAELKNTFCLTQEQYAFLSHHIGDMENYETLLSFEQGVAHFERLFRVRPQALACDLHPNYLATRYAQARAAEEGLPLVEVQHHHAHVAACMAEHGLDGSRPVIGVAFDGTGYGTDGAIWGGEFLIADYRASTRRAHLAYFPLPGGDAATRNPARIALALLWQLGLEWQEGLAPVEAICAAERAVLRAQLERQINTPLTSSMGRLFDAVVALAGGRQVVNYEAQAAIEFEALVDPHEQAAYPFLVDNTSPPFLAQPGQTPLAIPLGAGIEALLADVLAGVPLPILAARFHNGLVEMVGGVCEWLRAESGLNEVVLSGGVWQNMILLERVMQRLGQAGFQVYRHGEVPANDGGLALGQALIAAQWTS